MPAPDPLRDAEALRFRAQGWTYLRIAHEMGYTDQSGARKAVQRAMDRAPLEVEREAKALILSDLHAMKQAAWQVLESNHIVISQGRIVTLDDAPIPDDAPVLDAIDRIVKINQEMAKIYGLYAPSRSRIEVVDEDIAQALVAELEAELATLTADQSGGVHTDPPADS